MPEESTRRKATGSLARFREAAKTGGRLLPGVERYLMSLPPDDRPWDVIHPSEISDPDFCPRAIYLRLVNGPLPHEANRFQLENIFDNGHHIHEKWQNRWRAMGVLWGAWKCYACGLRWLALSPLSCPECNAGEWAIRYKEVPVRNEALRLSGHSDGEVRDERGNVMIEIKSVGEGTVRTEAPKLYTAHRVKAMVGDKEKTITDYPTLFRQLRQPFLKHRRQGWLYLALRPLTHPDEPPVDGMDFIYESKFTQATKEFFVRLDVEQVEEMFAECRDIVRAVELGREPQCRKGRHEECSQCTPYLKEQRADRPQGGTSGARERDQDGPRTSATVVPRRPRRAEGGSPGGAVRPLGGWGSRSDRTADHDQSLGGLLRRSTGTG